ncbi:DUF397 domain-containing protein [Streptomyces sp. NA02950]|uniref:DUF397 domain-containing protein n=1 Tax=Streptomyces sp. NA02950 TaxID=2742137 RepID=UPI0015911B57|nr:DUF397 domain-containing protein [Streptomyces sp. NA02950]QKV92484.1 DUF397 domain-containing protein [Streptomyces sp. NA02950]
MTAFAFRKASYSDPEHECVEVATNLPRTVAVRDSKNPRGPVLRFSPAAWAVFRAALTARAGGAAMLAHRVARSNGCAAR